MISFEKAHEIVLSVVPEVESEKIGLLQSLGRVLAQDVTADMDLPPFDKSAVDGFACRFTDIDKELSVKDMIAAGEYPSIHVGEGCCIRIMTGAPVPHGADCVVMIEDVEETATATIRVKNRSTARNICYKAEDVVKGSVVLIKSQLIQPQHIAVMASFGHSEVFVARKIRVYILSTGNELVDVDKNPQPGQIRNSNSSQLIAQALNLPVVIANCGTVADDAGLTYQEIVTAAEESDVLIISGGVSMGDFDLVPDALHKAGFKFLFRSIAIQPGKPTIFATRPDGKICFALPGNPVSVFNQFELLVKPAIYKMMGHNYQATEVFIPVARTYSRRRVDRLALVPISINEQSEAQVIEYHGSAHISAITQAKGWMYVPVGIRQIEKGERVRVRLL